MDVTRSVRQSHTEPHHNKSKTLFLAFYFLLFCFIFIVSQQEKKCSASKAFAKKLK